MYGARDEVVTATTVFAGPTISRTEIHGLLPGCEVRPPLHRGGLYELVDGRVDQDSSVVVVIDGLFGSNFAATAGEFADACSTGLRVVGAASLGAVRAMECAPYGMLGHGRIYQSYVEGIFVSDAEVAVAVNPDSDFEAVTVSMVDVRQACLRLRHMGILEDHAATDILDLSLAIHYLERSPQRLHRELTSHGLLLRAQFDVFMAAADAKLADARDCLRLVRSGGLRWPVATSSVPAARLGVRGFPTQVAGSLASKESRDDFLSWLVDSGRFPSCHRTQSHPAESILDELDAQGVLDAELLLWHARQTCASVGQPRLPH